MKSKSIQKQKLIIGGILVILVFSTFLYKPIQANGDDEKDEDNDGVDDDIEDENKRELSIEYGTDEAQIESSRDSNGNENSFTLQMKATSEGVEFNFEFVEGVESNETEIEFEITIPEIIEFNDVNENGIYDPLIDIIASTYEIENYLDLVHSTENINNDTVHTFTIKTDDGIFSTTMYVTSEFILMNEQIISPTQFKFDIKIRDFVFTETNSSLALKIGFDSEFETDYVENNETEDEKEGRSLDEQEIEIDYGNYTGFFSWSEVATIDGNETSVLETPLTEVGEDSVMYLNYPHGEVIIHDPKIGIEGLITGWESIETNFWVELPYISRNEYLIVSAISLIVIIGLIIVFRKK